MRKDTALYFAKCSAMAYPEHSLYYDVLDTFKNTIRLKDDHTDRGFIAHSGNSGVIIAIAGTRDIKDIVRDAEFKLTPYGDVRVHEGVLTEFRMIWPQIYDQIKASNRRNIFITGHSLGGGIATLVSLALKNSLWQDTKVITFGSLKVMDHNSAIIYNQYVPANHRVVHSDDIVPDLPPIGYYHVGSLSHINDDGTIDSNINSWWKRWKLFNKTIVDDIDGQALKDHHIDNYISAIERMV